jgi:hypothetical protein
VPSLHSRFIACFKAGGSALRWMNTSVPG